MDGADRSITQIVSKLDSGSAMNVNFETNSGASYDASKIYMNGNVVIKSITFSLPKSTDPVGKNVITYPSKIKMTYSRLEGKNANLRTKVGFGGKQITKEIPIILQRNTTTGNIDGCYAVQLGETINGVTNDGNNNVNQEFCSNLGSGNSLYIWDSTANKCVLKNNVCPDKFVFAGISSTGNAICYPVGNYLQYMVDTTASSCNTTPGATVNLTTDASGMVKINCIGSAADAPPTNLQLTHTANARSFLVSWTAGSGNGGANGCQLQYLKNGTTWTTLAGTQNCDSTVSNASFSLPATTGWTNNFNATGVQVRIVRVSDSTAMGTFSQRTTCTSKAGSSTSTPSIDENCNGNWDDTSGSPGIYGATPPLTAGTTYNIPPTLSGCNYFQSVWKKQGTAYNSSDGSCSGGIKSDASVPYLEKSLYGSSVEVVPSTGGYGGTISSSACIANYGAPWGQSYDLKVTSPSSNWDSAYVYYDCPMTYN